MKERGDRERERETEQTYSQNVEMGEQREQT